MVKETHAFLKKIRIRIDRYARREDTYIAKTLQYVSPVKGKTYRESRTKRAMDIGIAFPAWVITLPVQAVARGLIKLEDGGKTTFVDERVIFRDNKWQTLRVRKLRTMSEGANDQLVENEIRNTSHDPRVTKIGRIIRKLNIDELPQLLQVAKGDMTLIGPRVLEQRDIDGVHGMSASPHFEDWVRAYEGKPGLLSPPAILYGKYRRGGPAWLNATSDIHYAKVASLGTDIYFLTRFFLGIADRRRIELPQHQQTYRRAA